MSLKVAIVGCGKIADAHVEEIRKMPEKASVVAVCDLEPLMAEQLAVRYGIRRYYSDLNELLKRESPDALHITTPPQSHLAVASRALAAGCHVYVEKPLTLNYADSLALVQCAEQANRKLTIGYSHLFSPAAMRLRELIEQGVLGEPVHAESFFGYNLSGPFGTAILSDPTHWVHSLPGKLFHNNIDHLLYKALDFMDDDRPCIRALGYVRRQQRFGDHRDDMLDELRVTMQGARVTFSAVFSSHIQPAAHLLRVYGTRNTIQIDYETRTLTVDASANLPSAIGRLVPPFATARAYWRAGMDNVRRFRRHDYHYFAGMNRLMSMFYDSILADSTPPIAYADMLRVSAMMDEIFRQVNHGSVW